MNIINRENLRDALIATTIGGLVAWTLNGCATQQAPAAPTVTQLAPEPTLKPAPRITGAMILAQQPPEIQQAIQQHAAGGAWPSFKWPRERLVPYTDHATPLPIDVAPFKDVDLALQPGEQIDGFALGDDERFLAAPMTSGDPASASSRSIESAIWEPRLVPTIAWISSTIKVLAVRSIRRPPSLVSNMYSDSGVVTMTCGGRLVIRVRSDAGVSPVRTSVRIS